VSNKVDLHELSELPRVNPLPVLLCDANGHILYRNPAAEDFPDCFPPEVYRIEQVLPTQFTEILRRLMESGEPLKDQLWESHGRTLCATYQPLENKEKVFVVIVDETERIELTRQAQAYAAKLEEAYRDLQDAQTQLIQSGKMAALGSLVSGIAHELNSPLGALTANTDTRVRCLERLDDELRKADQDRSAQNTTRVLSLTQTLRDLQAVDRAGLERISGLVASLRAFARLDRASEDEVDIHEGLDSALTLLTHEFNRGIEVRRDYRLEERVRSSPGEINQVFMNLLLNAAQAMPEVGTLDIRTYRQDGIAVIEIEDDGEGIPEKNLERIFDPGFTTRGVGVGTGLGLAIVYRVIQEHGGNIEVSSTPGKGSLLRLSLPIQTPSAVGTSNGGISATSS